MKRPIVQEYEPATAVEEFSGHAMDVALNSIIEMQRRSQDSWDQLLASDKLGYSEKFVLASFISNDPPQGEEKPVEGDAIEDNPICPPPHRCLDSNFPVYVLEEDTKAGIGLFTKDAIAATIDTIGNLYYNWEDSVQADLNFTFFDSKKNAENILISIESITSDVKIKDPEFFIPLLKNLYSSIQNLQSAEDEKGIKSSSHAQTYNYNLGQNSDLDVQIELNYDTNADIFQLNTTMVYTTALKKTTAK